MRLEIENEDSDHALMDTSTATLLRWLTGPRFSALPIKSADHPAPKLSFEFFPPRTEALEQQLWTCIERLAPLAPRFVSVTYGAGGTPRPAPMPRWHGSCRRQAGAGSASDLCRCDPRRGERGRSGLLGGRCAPYRRVARRPAAGSAYQPHPGGYRYASDLVAGLKKVADFEISVAAYPKCIRRRASPVADLENLKRKLDAGATRAITQYFFDTSTYLRFIDLCLAAGIKAPIVPGIMPVSNYAQIVKFSAMCGASVPEWMGRLFEGTDNDPETRRMVGMVVAAEQVRLLQANGVDEFHFYTLNRPDLTYAIAHVLGVRPVPSSAA